MLLNSNFSSFPVGIWQEEIAYKGWHVQPSGEQSVEVTDQGLELDTGFAKVQSETFAGLVTSEQRFFQWNKLNVTYETLTRRRENPNPWEVAWVLWNFENVNRFYSAILKPDGWEIAKEWLDSDGYQRQDFLYFSASSEFPVEHKYELQIKQEISGPSITFTLSAKDLTTGSRMKKLGTVTDDGTRESGPSYFGGKVGLYVEDCRARYYKVTIK